MIYILIGLAATLVLGILYLSVGNGLYASKKAVFLSEAIEKLASMQIIILPLVLFLGTIGASYYKGHTSAKKATESYKAYVMAFSATRGEERITLAVIDSIKAVGEANGLNAVEIDKFLINTLSERTGVSYTGFDEYALTGANVLATFLNLAWVVLIMFILSPRARRYNEDILDMNKVEQEAANYNFWTKNYTVGKRSYTFIKPFIVILGLIIVTIFAVKNYYFTDASFNVVINLFIVFVIGMIILTEYNTNKSKASTGMLVTIYGIGAFICIIYGIDLYQDWNFTVDLGAKTTHLKLIEYRSQLQALHAEFLNLVNAGHYNTADWQMVNKYRTVVQGQDSILQAMHQFEDFESNNHLRTFVTQFAITVFMIGLDTITMLWASFSGALNNLLDLVLDNTANTGKVAAEDFRNNFTRTAIELENSSTITRNAQFAPDPLKTRPPVVEPVPPIQTTTNPATNVPITPTKEDINDDLEDDLLHGAPF